MRFFKRTAALLLALLTAALCCGCEKEQERPEYADKTIKYYLEEDPRTLDPQIATDSSSLTVIEAIYEGLVRLDAQGEPYPGAAERWESNNNFTQFTFYLRQDARWSEKDENGDIIPVTAHDFVYALQRAVNPATGSQTCDALYCIENAQQIHTGDLPVESLGVRALDDYTLVITLEYSYEEFPKLTASAPFMPCNKAFFESTSGKYGLETETVLSNGPFKLRNRYAWEHDKELTLARSSSYTGEKDVIPSTIEFIMGEEADVSDPIAALSDGVVDAIAIPASLAAQAEEKGFSTVSFEDTTWGLLFNTAASYDGAVNVMSSEQIRGIFVQTLPRAALLEHIPASCSPANDIIPPLTTYLGQNYRELAGSDFYVAQDDSVAANLSSALAQIGSDMPVINVLCPDDPDVKLMVNEMLTAWYEKLGYYFNMEPLSESELFSRVQNGSYQLALYPLHPSADGPEEILSMFCSGNSQNFSGLADAQYDAFLDSAKNAQDSIGLESLKAAEQYLNQRFIFYPIYYQKSYYACNKGVSGILFRPYGAAPDFIFAGKID